jgi:hypothetical protein
MIAIQVSMKRSWALLLAPAVALCVLAQAPPRPGTADDFPRLPNGKSQTEAIVKAEHEDSLRDAAELVKLAEDLKAELEKNDRHVVSVKSVRQTEDIEKLAKRIRSRLKRH